MNTAEIDKKRCKACGLCADACPKKIITINPYAESAYGRGCAEVSDGCVGCGTCAVVCPDIAITLRSV